MSTSQNLGKRKTAGIIVIGDEILNGSQLDTNSNFLCQRLHKRGVAVKKITVVGDVVQDIASNIASFSYDYDFVFTTGGIGPTHDDLTYQGLAEAFGDKLELNKELKSVFDDFLNKYKQREDAEEAINKFCSIPSNAALIYGDKNGARKFPCVQMKNVISLPGVPTFCQQGFDQLESTLFSSDDSTTPFFSKNMYLGKNEIHIQHGLGAVARKYSNEGVTIGSYPVIGNSYYKTKLTIEAPDDESGNAAFDDLTKAFNSFVRTFDESPWENTVEKFERFRQSVEPELAKKLDDATNLIGDILKQYSYDEVMLSFNGGKDCTLLLHLLRVKMDEIYGPEKMIRAFHILCEDEFQELRHFLLDICWKYNVQLKELGGSMKAGLVSLKEESPHVKAVFMGSRSTDPHGKFMKSNCQWTDKDWPQFYRVCPIFDWTYGEIWTAIRGLCIPYCVLYDRGYTSLGDRSKTRPNPALKIEGQDTYRPAYCLYEGSKEREGRSDSPSHKI